LGWQPTIPLAEGLKRTTAYFAGKISAARANGNSASAVAADDLEFAAG
jgi:hypothetical protein